MTLDAEHDPSSGSYMYLVGGLANEGAADDFGFMYSYLDDQSVGACGLRHSMKVTSLDLGIQAVSIAPNVLWAVGLSSGQPWIGVYDTTNVVIRLNRNDLAAEPEFYRVDFKGIEAGSVAERMTVLKMVNFGDSQIAMQSLSEVRLINIEKNRVHGFFTYDLGDEFLQRDIYTVPHATTPSSWNLYMAYPKFDYNAQRLFIMVDLIGVSSDLTLSNQRNIFHGLSQFDGADDSLRTRSYRTIRIAVSEDPPYLAMCAQSFQQIGFSEEASQTTNIFMSIDLSNPRTRQVNLKAIEQPFGAHFECQAAKMTEAGDQAYFLLDDSRSHRTQVLSFDMKTSELYDYPVVDLPYTTNHYSHDYVSKRAVLLDQTHFVMAIIDQQLYGQPTAQDYHVGYLINSADSTRINKYMQHEGELARESVASSFTDAPYISYLYIDTKLETQSNPVTKSTYFAFGVTLDDVSMVKPWINHYCPQSYQPQSFANVMVELGYSFEYAFQQRSFNDLEATCYPHLYVRFEGPASADNIVTDLAVVPSTLSFRVLINELDSLSGVIKITGGVVSEAYTLDPTLFDSVFQKQLLAQIREPTFNTVPVFADSLQPQAFTAESSMIYVLPTVIDPEQPDQTVTVTIEPSQSNSEWLKVAPDSTYIYVGAGKSTAHKMGDYYFTITISDGYLFGPNSSTYSLKVTILTRPNQLPYFGGEGLLTQRFPCEAAFEYVLPDVMDDDNDLVTLTYKPGAVRWLRLSPDQKRLTVAEGAVIGVDMLGEYTVTFVLEDDSDYGFPRVASYQLTVVVEVPENDAPIFDPAMVLKTEFETRAESKFSYTLPLVIDDERTAKDVTIELIDAESIPWLEVQTNGFDSPTVRAVQLYIGPDQVKGPESLGTYNFKLQLNDHFAYGPATTEYAMQLTVIAPLNSLPRFVNPFIYSVGKDALIHVAGDPMTFVLPQVTDFEQQGPDLVTTLDNSACPWLLYDPELHALRVKPDTTLETPLGNYPFSLLVSDGWLYGENTLTYDYQIRVERRNSKPVFAEDLPAKITFRAEGSLEFALPPIEDADGDPVTVTINSDKLPWLEYDAVNNALIVQEGSTTEAQIGDYECVIILDDGYPHAQSQTIYVLAIYMDIADRPFFVFEAKNEAPVFVEGLTTQVDLQFETGKAWVYELPAVSDFENDPIFIEVASEDAAAWLKVDNESDPRTLYIEEGSTSLDQIGKFVVEIAVTDQPEGDTQSKSTLYQLALFGVDPTTLANLARAEPPPPQTGELPQVKVSSITQFGLVTLGFTKSLGFPADMADRINSFSEPIVIEPGKPFVPKVGALGFVEVPYVRVMILASADREQIEDLSYSWKATSVTSTSMVFQFEFKSPLKVSDRATPELVQFEFHIQEFTDASGKGIKDSLSVTKFMPQQIANDDAAQQLASSGESIEGTTTYVVIFQIVLNILLNSAFEKLWIMVNGLQFIVTIPLMPVNFPANAQVILSSLVNIANFDLIPTGLIFPFIYDFKDSEPFNLQFQSGGYDSGYLAENMGTVFVMFHFFAFALLLMAFSLLFRRKSQWAARLANYLWEKLAWNAIVVFIMQAYIETGLCSLAVVKRWSLNDESDFNDKSNVIYGVVFMITLVFYPCFMASLYFFNKTQIDSKKFQELIGGPYEGLKRHHRQRAIFYVMYYLGRRMVFVTLIVLGEGRLFITLVSTLITAELSLAFILSERPFHEPLRNRLEIFNETVLVLMVLTTFCFTDVMDAEATLSIGLWLILAIAVYVFVHIVVLMWDNLVKLGRLIWLQLSKCACGKRLQQRAKRRYIKLRRAILRIKPPQPPAPRLPPPEPQSESDSSTPNSEIPTPNSSLSITDYENILNQYTQQVNQERPTSATSHAFPLNRGTVATSRLTNNILVMQRQRQEPDPLDFEMDFWMREIEQMEQARDQRRAPESKSPRTFKSPSPREISQAELAQQNPLDLIFVPDDWMTGGDAQLDDAFEPEGQERGDDILIELIDINQPEPIRIKRPAPSQKKQKSHGQNQAQAQHQQQQEQADLANSARSIAPVDDLNELLNNL